MKPQMNRQKLNEVLLSLLGSQNMVDAWWKSPNASMNFQVPEKLIETAPEKVSEFVLQHILYG